MKTDKEKAQKKAPAKKVTTVSPPPAPKHNKAEKAAIAASLKLNKKQYDSSPHHDAMPYEAAKSFANAPATTALPNPKIGGVATLRVTKGIGTNYHQQTTLLDQDESFMKDIVECRNINEFNTVFDAHYKGKQIKHKSLGVIIEPQSIKPSVLDSNKNTLQYKLKDTTGGVQLEKFFQFFELVD